MTGHEWVVVHTRHNTYRHPTHSGSVRLIQQDGALILERRVEPDRGITKRYEAGHWTSVEVGDVTLYPATSDLRGRLREALETVARQFQWWRGASHALTQRQYQDARSVLDALQGMELIRNQGDVERRSQVTLVADLHRPVGSTASRDGSGALRLSGTRCCECGHDWPCRTAQALELGPGPEQQAKTMAQALADARVTSLVFWDQDGTEHHLDQDAIRTWQTQQAAGRSAPPR